MSTALHLPETQAAPLAPLSDSERRAWLVDVDGTLALRRAGGRGPYDFDRVSEDVPHDPVVRIVRALALLGDQFIVLSGRLESCRTDTTLWLFRHVFDALPDGAFLRLLMRPNSRPYDKDVDVKRDMYEGHVRGRYSVHGVLDDRAQCVALWRELGLTCLAVGDGDF